MEQRFEYLEHTADIFFRAYGVTTREVFENSALAMFNSMADLKKFEPKIAITIELEHAELDMLLHDFLEELLIEHETRNMIFTVFKVMVIENKKEKKFELKAIVVGDEIKDKKMLRTQIKAITFHELEVGEMENGVKYGQVILDI